MIAIQGYILINSQKWRVSMHILNTILSLKQRKNGKDGDHLVEIQAYLDQPQYRMLVDALCQGTTVCLPKSATDRPTPPAAT